MEKECNVDERKKMQRFIIIWIGQFISILGSAISSFGLSIWIIYETGSAMSFAMSFLCNILPAIILSPFSGSFADRKERKKIIIITDSLDAVLKVILIGLFLSKSIQIWIVYLIIFISSSLSTFQGPAFNASIPMIVPEKYLNKANGMLQFSQAAQSLLAPILAGGLYIIIGLNGLLIIDFISFFFAIATIGTSNIPQPNIEKENKSILNIAIKDFKFAWNYLKQKEGIITLLFSFALLNFIVNITMVLLAPLVLVNYNSAIYGLIESTIGLAMLGGGILATLSPNVEKKVKIIFLILAICSSGLMISGWSSIWQVIDIGLFIFFLPIPYVNALFQSILQINIASEVLGRVGALVNAILKMAIPLACIMAGGLADNIFEPFMNSNKTIVVSFIGKLIGTGDGRGIGLIFILCGILLSATCIFMLCNKKILNIKDGSINNIKN